MTWLTTMIVLAIFYGTGAIIKENDNSLSSKCIKQPDGWSICDGTSN